MAELSLCLCAAVCLSVVAAVFGVITFLVYKLRILHRYIYKVGKFLVIFPLESLKCCHCKSYKMISYRVCHMIMTKHFAIIFLMIYVFIKSGTLCCTYICTLFTFSKNVEDHTFSDRRTWKNKFKGDFYPRGN